MPVRITTRNAPGAIRDDLTARAAKRGESMRAYLHGALEAGAGARDITALPIQLLPG